MTRASFFRLIAGLWAGQATTSGKPGMSPICFAGTSDPNYKCPVPGETVVTAQLPGACKPGEERCPLGHCPLGHCQKPRYVVIEGHIVDMPEQEVEHHPAQSWNDVPFNSGGEVIPEWHIPAFDTYKTNLHICAVCGVCYVPPSSK